MAAPGMHATAGKTSITGFHAEMVGLEALNPYSVKCPGLTGNLRSEITVSTGSTQPPPRRARRTLGQVLCAPQLVQSRLRPGGCVRFAAGVAVAYLSVILMSMQKALLPFQTIYTLKLKQLE